MEEIFRGHRMWWWVTLDGFNGWDPLLIRGLNPVTWDYRRCCAPHRKISWLFPVELHQLKTPMNLLLHLIESTEQRRVMWRGSDWFQTRVKNGEHRLADRNERLWKILYRQIKVRPSEIQHWHSEAPSPSVSFLSSVLKKSTSLTDVSNVVARSIKRKQKQRSDLVLDEHNSSTDAGSIDGYLHHYKMSKVRHSLNPLWKEQKSIPAAVIIQRWWKMAKDRKKFNAYMNLRNSIRQSMVFVYFATWASHSIAISHHQRTIVRKCLRAWKVCDHHSEAEESRTYPREEMDLTNRNCSHSRWNTRSSPCSWHHCTHSERCLETEQHPVINW